MSHALLQWKCRNYFDYSIHHLDEVASEEIWNWHRTMVHEFECMLEGIKEFAAFEFHWRILSIHYIEWKDKIFLPCAGTNFAHLPQLTEE